MENQSRAIKILPDAGMVLAGLHRSGFQAYVVGGDDSGQWTLAVRGFHPEMMQRLRALLAEA